VFVYNSKAEMCLLLLKHYDWAEGRQISSSDPLPRPVADAAEIILKRAKSWLFAKTSAFSKASVNGNNASKHGAGEVFIGP
jgi:hypothetical protein